jgi:hypothetical protein
MDTKLLFHGLALTLLLSQALSATMIFARYPRPALILAMLAPLLALALTLFLIDGSRAWPNLTPFELSFLISELLACLSSTAGLASARCSITVLFWVSWCLNLYGCIVVTYLAFFFAIRF